MRSAVRIGKICGSGFYPVVTCSECGKKKPLPCPAPDWPFKYNGKYFCCWTCMRKYEAGHPRRRTNFYLDYLA